MGLVGDGCAAGIHDGAADHQALSPMTRSASADIPVNCQAILLWHNVYMSDKYTVTLRQAKDLAMNVAAGVLDRPVADLTNDLPLDSDDLDLVLSELSLAGIEVERDRIKTVGDLIQRLRAGSSGADLMMPPSAHALTLGQADQARSDFALIENQLEFLASQLAKQPTRGDLAKSALGIIFCTAVLTTLFIWIAWR